MIALALTVALFLLLGVLNSYALFWYETANGDHLEPLREMSGGRIVRWLAAAVVSAWLAALMVLLTFPLGLAADRRRKPVITSSGPVVLLIHGLYHNPGAWVFYRLYLRRCGYRNVVLFRYSSWNVAFSQIAARCREEIKSLANESPWGLYVIGHSLGGLIAVKALSELGPETGVKGLVTLGTPFGGSRLAVLAAGRLGRSLRCGGALVRDIEEADSRLQTTRLAVYSPLDNMVLPNSCLTPYHDDWQVMVTGPVSHVGLLYHPRTMRRVRRFLDQRGACCHQQQREDERGST